MNRFEMAKCIADRLREERRRLWEEYRLPGTIPSFVIDNVLPQEVARGIFAAFPERGRMKFKNSIRERKFVAAQMDQYDSILEEVVFAFQEDEVVKEIAEITGIARLEPDSNLYAGGISIMSKGHYLKPHLDNSHDAKQEKYRAVNLLYYVTPDWCLENGGNLELWDDGLENSPRTIQSSFNRLVLMATNQISWHSVSTINHEAMRCCVSNYYFCERSPEKNDYFHATSFRGRPDEPLRDVVMRADNALRTGFLKMTGTRVYKNPHIYKRET